MNPRTANPHIREVLVETAARLLSEGGPELLTLRRLTQEVGTSTMAVYTHFGSMDDLRFEVAREGFKRLRRRLAAVDHSADPVVDMARLGLAYLTNAMEDAHIYRVTFGPGADAPDASELAGVGYDTFMVLVDGVERCIEAGRFGPADPVDLATQLWSTLHGAVALAQAGLLDESGLNQVFVSTTINLFVGFGDDRDKVMAAFVDAEY